MAEPHLYSLPQRGLLAVHGPEAEGFLHDLVTADIRGLPEGSVRPGALLTPQGRILHDLLISRDGTGFLLECDITAREDLFRRLKLFRLRRNLVLEPDDRPVHARAGAAAGLKDERFAENVRRYYGDLEGDAASAEAWKHFRWLRGVPEGGLELPPEKALPLEARLDLSNGISFDKGCYIGQEVTARTRYRGLIKRSYVPFRGSALIAPPADVHVDGRDAGFILDTVSYGEGCLGLASLRLEYLRQDAASFDAGGIAISPFVPPRLSPLPGAVEE